MIRFLGDENGVPFPGSGEKGPLLLLSDIEQDCLNWLTDTADSAQESIPLALYKDGYDVWLGCRRGTTFSRVTNNDDDISDADESQSFFNYNTEDIGEEDIPKMISKILFERKKPEDADSCAKVQILLNGYAMSETLTTMAKYPNDSLARIRNIAALAPCAIPTNFASEEGDTRILSAVDARSELDTLFEADAGESKGRKLSYGHYILSDFYWTVTLD